MIGNVRWFNESKGYGFILGQDKQSYFVHFSEIKSEGFRTLIEGDKVDFIADKNEKGLVAKQVSTI